MLKPLNLILLLLFTYSYSFGGDDPCASTSVSVSTAFNTFNNVGNSDSGIGTPPYGFYSGADTWISFTAPASGEAYILVSSIDITDMAMAVYLGPCDDLQLHYNVTEDLCTGGTMPNIQIIDLNPGEEYFIRLWAEDGSSGDFNVVVSEILETQNLNFLPYFDATTLGDDCIQLTTETTGQHGCTYYENQIDFAQPFTHTMEMSFGDNDGGADGICLVYQPNGVDICGNTGQGIGAEGIPESVIVEFDTYRNGGLLDPFQDHASINVNGNMNHANSIDGPIDLGNIEDGNVHIVTFTWDPATSSYEVIFDGVVIMSGSNDFINNVFGGQTLVNWGYTASTGALFNNQIVCPQIVEINVATTEYIENEECRESDEFFNFTQPSAPCEHLVNVGTIALEIPEPVILFEEVCSGDGIFIFDQYFEGNVNEEIIGQAHNGCDSVVHLILTELVLDVEVSVSNPIDCNNETSTLSYSVNTNNGVQVDATWAGPNNYFNTDQEITVENAGTYNLYIDYYYDDLQCFSASSGIVTIDTISPTISLIDSVFVECGDSSILATAQVNSSNNYTAQWSYNSTIVSDSLSTIINSNGTYFFEVSDLVNGCNNLDSVEAVFSGNIPSIVLTDDTLNCFNEAIQLTPDVSNDVVRQYWLLNGDTISTDINPIINQSGTYQLIVENAEDCTNAEIMQIFEDKTLPIVTVSPDTIPCNTAEIDVSLQSNNNIYHYEWSNTANFSSTEETITISEGGLYFLQSTNPNNGCVDYDTLSIFDRGISPLLDINNFELDCNNPEDVIVLSGENNSSFNYSWTKDNNQQIGDSTLLVNQDGHYEVVVTTQTGCVTTLFTNISIDTIAPSVLLSALDLDCDLTSLPIEVDGDQGFSYQWTGPNNFNSNEISPIVDHVGQYQLLVTNPNNGCINNLNIEISSIGEIPVFTIQNDTITCFEPEVNLHLDILTTFSNLTWTDPDGNTLLETNPSITSPGVYQLSFDGLGGCDVDTSLFIDIDTIEPHHQFITEDITCDNPLGFISSNPLGSKILDFAWKDINGNYISFQNYHDISIPGRYIHEATGENGCKSIDTLTVLAFTDDPAINIPPVDVITCLIPNVHVQSIVQESVDYSWFDQYGQVISDENNILVENPGYYTIEVTNMYGCTSRDSVEILAFLDPPNLSANVQDIDCSNDNGIISVNSDGIVLNVTGPNGFQINNTNTFDVSHAGLYEITSTNQYGCDSMISVIINDTTAYPELTLLSSDTIVFETDETASILVHLLSSEPISNIQWTPSDGLSCDDCLIPEFDGSITNGITYTLTVTNQQGCMDEIMVFTRFVEPEILVDIIHPDIISANADGWNDKFTIYGNPEEHIEKIKFLQIYDRWGNKVFQRDDFPINDPSYGWDGTLNGKQAANGVYVFYSQVLLTTGKTVKVKGDVTVIR